MNERRYQPIDCGLHSRLELAVMQRTRLTLRWRTARGERRAAVVPRDLRTRDGAEYLFAATQPSGAVVCLRLDRLVGLT